ncbi:uncharacterized protein KQ657_003125 [Scheffersomyces spartinae]|uniref:DUF3533 domain-containing protein n=1 Tax=Scheffersomyces spartinae TaxID=45513 RepID=A0A9P7V566_9ASCO|nr:uncharacterized protein KQ657_003125 [Scheffersomyces spartinae]KAG7191450.1 hypothetical protein KQ657_003125 [Scheffersomyces spartinae]
MVDSGRKSSTDSLLAPATPYGEEYLAKTMSQKETYQGNGEPIRNSVGSQRNSISSDHFSDDDDENIVMGYSADVSLELGIKRTPTILDRIQSRYSFFNEKLHSQRKSLVWTFLTVYFIMAFFVISIFSIYWGSMYGRDGRVRNLKMLVVIEDDIVINGTQPVVGDFFQQLLTNNKQTRPLGDWRVYNSSTLTELKSDKGRTTEEEIIYQIHHQNFWSSIWVKPNSSYNYVQALESSDPSLFNTSIVTIYETGRDFTNVPAYVTPQIRKIESIWLAQQPTILGQLFNNTFFNMNKETFKIVSTPWNFDWDDLIPFTDPVLVAPSQVGLIYIIIMTFFQVGFFADTHKKVAQEFHLKPLHYVMYRYFSACMTYLVLSLAYCFVTLAFQVDFTKAFGRAGFVVFWMSSFLTMFVVGFANEIMGMFFIMVYPSLVGFWLLFWVISNIAPTFAPLALSPEFFRYGYAMPLHNSYDITKVIFFNTYKGGLGRNYGILAAWVVLLSAAFPFVLKIFGNFMRKQMAAAQQQQTLPPPSPPPAQDSQNTSSGTDLEK